MSTPDLNKDASRPANRHVLTAVEKQRAQLDKLLKDPTKTAYVPPPPKEKTIRPPREMMKNVQGSSAGAGSGEFHVYKASRRREYERLNLLEEQARKETETAEFERRRKEAEELAEAKTAKNRAKRQKKKERSKVAKSESKTTEGRPSETGDGSGAPLKKRRLINGRELVFKRQDGEDDDEEQEGEDDGSRPEAASVNHESGSTSQEPIAVVVEPSRVVIHDD